MFVTEPAGFALPSKNQSRRNRSQARALTGIIGLLCPHTAGLLTAPLVGRFFLSGLIAAHRNFLAGSGPTREPREKVCVDPERQMSQPRR
jgi:hypothetical protein